MSCIDDYGKFFTRPKGGEKTVKSDLDITEEPSRDLTAESPRNLDTFLEFEAEHSASEADDALHITEDLEPHPEMLDIKDEDDERLDEEYPLFSGEVVDEKKTSSKVSKKLHQRPLLLLAILVVVVYVLIIGVPALFVYLRTH